MRLFNRHIDNQARPVSLEPLEQRCLLSAVDPTAATELLADTAAVVSSPFTRQVENLDRGVIAMRTGANSAYVGWRMLGKDPDAIGFNLYRQTNGGSAIKLNSSLLTQTTDFVDNSAINSAKHTYFVRAVTNGAEGQDSASFTLEPGGVQPFLSIPLQPPPGGVTPDGESYTYTANDASVGDVDGDGQYEIILKWDPTNSTDNSQDGYTGNVYVDAYKLDGTRLWRIDLGRNIRAGAHYTQFAVYDLDGDGRAEVSMKTAPGTIDGQGNAVLMGNDSALDDYRDSAGWVLTGPEYYTVFDGFTGEELDTVAMEPARGSVSEWGDGYGNRVDRFTTGVAYLDGTRPSVVLGRGYYGPRSGFNARNEIAAYDFRDGQLSVRWIFKANTQGLNSEYIGEGAHSLTVGDVDGDGYDEIVYGASVIDHDGTGLYATQLGHGDALHLSDMDPTRPGQEVFMVHESQSAYESQGRDAGGELRDAATGELLFQIPSNNDVGRGVAGDIDPNHLGYEFWATTNEGTRMIYNVDGTALYETPSNMMYNFVIHWDADLSHELLDRTTISKWNSPGRSNFDLDPTSSSYYPVGVTSNNSTKSTPALAADILGDWRDEVIWRTSDNTALHIYSTTIAANSRMYTLMHDTQYRVSIAAQNSAYNQPAHPSFYVGEGMAPPPTANVEYAVFNSDLPDPPATVTATYQAETALQTNVFAESNHDGFNGSAFINFDTDNSSVVFDNADGGAGGATTIRFRYALGATTSRTGVLTVNNIARPITFAPTGAWNNWQTLQVTVDLNEGLNTIAIESNGQDLANIDELQIDVNQPTMTLLGDYNNNGTVDSADYTIWADNFGSTTQLAADGNGDGIVDSADYTVWQDNFGATITASVASAQMSSPEPYVAKLTATESATSPIESTATILEAAVTQEPAMLEASVTLTEAKAITVETAVTQEPTTQEASAPLLDVDNVIQTLEYPTSYAGSQDVVGGVTIDENGKALTLTGNTWKRFAIDLDVQPDTTLNFELETPDAGQFISIGLDNNNKFRDSKRLFQVAGNERLNRWAFQDFRRGSGSYSIPVGLFYTGRMSYLTLVADDDLDASADVTFRDLRITRR